MDDQEARGRSSKKKDGDGDKNQRQKDKRRDDPVRVGFLGLQVSESRPFAGLRGLRLGKRH